MSHRNRKRSVLLTAAAALAVAGPLISAPPTPAAAATGSAPAAEVSPHAAQTIDDIGASGAWWVNDLQNFSPKVQARVAKLLFSTGDASQRWLLNADGQILSEASGKCLDVSGQATADGSRVILYSCNSGANEAWTTQ